MSVKKHKKEQPPVFTEGTTSWHTITPSLAPEILDGLNKLQFNEMTPVQSQTIPILLRKRDVVVEAVTGSGKTLAYLVPILHYLLERNRSSDPLSKYQIGAVIISPTRELAFQIYRVVQHFLPMTPGNYLVPNASEGTAPETTTPPQTTSQVTHALLVGGHHSTEDDLAYFRAHGAHVVVATPGRLASFIDPRLRCGRLCLKECDWLILDEADKLMDAGLGPTVQAMLPSFPKQRHTGLFSATLNDHLQLLLSQMGGLRGPVHVTVQVVAGEQGHVVRTPATLRMEYLVVTTAEKTCWLLHCFQHYLAPGSKTMVFFNTCHQVAYWYTMLRPHVPHLFSLHGHQAPKRRESVYQTFVQTHDTTAILLCTDVAARGLDIPCLDYVIQFDPPTDPSMFAHRCGRAGRQGQFGSALLFLTEKETTFVEFLQLRQVPITPCETMQNIQPAPLPFSWIDQVLQDRLHYELSVRAFVAYIRAYSLHTLTYLFPFNDLDWQGLVDLFGLIHIPSMPELRHRSVTVPVQIDLDTLEYRDPVRERARKARLEKTKSTLAKQTKLTSSHTSSNALKRKNAIPWSEKLFRMAKKRQRKEKRAKKKAPEFPTLPTPISSSSSEAQALPVASLSEKASLEQKKKDEAILALFKEVEREAKHAFKKKRGGQTLRIRASDYARDIGYQDN